MEDNEEFSLSLHSILAKVHWIQNFKFRMSIAYNSINTSKFNRELSLYINIIRTTREAFEAANYTLILDFTACI